MGALIKGLDGLSRGVLWLGVILMPLIALAGGLGFQAIGFFLGIAMILVWVADRTGAAYLKSSWPIGLLGFTVWAWVSTLWSPFESTLLGGNGLVLLVLTVMLLFVPLAFLRLTARMKSVLIWVVIIGAAIGVILMVVDAATGYAISIWADPVAPGGDPIQRRSDAEMNLGRGQVSYGLLVWPIAALMITRFKGGVVLAAGVLIALAASAQLNDLSIIIPTLGFSACFAALAWWRPRLGLILAFTLAIASLAFAPVLGFLSGLVDPEAMRKIPLSWEHRLRMWAYSWDLIQQAPLIGHGFDSARVFDSLTFRVPDGRDVTVMSMHPHNIGLQIWLETGLVGVGLIVSTLVLLLKTALKTCQNSARAMAVAGLVVATATCGAVTVGVWQHWWWALVVLAVSFVILIPSEQVNRT